MVRMVRTDNIEPVEVVKIRPQWPKMVVLHGHFWHRRTFNDAQLHDCSAEDGKPLYVKPRFRALGSPDERDHRHNLWLNFNSSTECYRQVYEICSASGVAYYPHQIFFEIPENRTVYLNDLRFHAMTLAHALNKRLAAQKLYVSLIGHCRYDDVKSSPLWEGQAVKRTSQEWSFPDSRFDK
jgi:hypothetical protein